MALAQSPSDVRFDVVSVRENASGDLVILSEPPPPDGYRRDLPLFNHLTYAFDIVQSSRIVNIPEWVSTTRYEIAGKASGPIDRSSGARCCARS